MPFSGNATVVPSRAYVHPVSGRTFSQFSSWVEPGAVLVERGFTIAWSGDGTVGTCKPPFSTREEAQAFADKWNKGRADNCESWASDIEQAASELETEIDRIDNLDEDDLEGLDYDPDSEEDGPDEETVQRARDSMIESAASSALEEASGANPGF